MESHIFGIWGSENILASRTICDTNMRVKDMFYIQFNKCVNSF